HPPHLLLHSFPTRRSSDLPAHRVIGSGTTVDSARLSCELGAMYDLDSKSVQAFVIGEHGDSEMVAWSSATIGGKKVEDVLADNADRKSTRLNSSHVSISYA